MFTQKSISISIICDNGEYTASVNNDYYLNTDKDEPIAAQKDRIYRDKSIENIQKQVKEDFGVEIENLFNWYWMI